MTSKTQSPIENHVQHVGKVQLAVIAVSFGLLLALSVEEAHSLARALEQARVIQEGLSSLDPRAIRGELGRAARPGSAGAKPTLGERWIELDGKSYRVGLPDPDGGRPDTFLARQGIWCDPAVSLETRRALVAFEEQTSLASFATWWDSLEQVIRTNAAADYRDAALVRDHGGGKLRRVSLRTSPEGTAAHSGTWLLSLEEVEAVLGPGASLPGELSNSSFVLTAEIPAGDVLIPVVVEAATFRGQEVVQRALSRPWPSGPFASAFPELNAYTSDFQETSLASCIRELENGLGVGSSGVDLQAFGFTVPARAVHKTGIPFLAVLLIYLTFVLFEFHRRLAGDRSASPPNALFLLAFPSRLAWLFYLLVAFVFPAFVTLSYVRWTHELGIASSEAWALLLASAFVVLLCCAGSIHQAWRIRALLAKRAG